MTANRAEPARLGGAFQTLRAWAALRSAMTGWSLRLGILLLAVATLLSSTTAAAAFAGYAATSITSHPEAPSAALDAPLPAFAQPLRDPPVRANARRLRAPARAQRSEHARAVQHGSGRGSRRDQVLSWSEATGEVALKRVTERFETPERPLIELTAQGESGSERLSATPGHPFWVEQLGWVHAAELTQQDVLRSVSVQLAASVLARSPATERGPPGGLVPLRVAPSESAGQSRVGTVYNVTVGEFHTYFVGRAGVLVHNAS